MRSLILLLVLSSLLFAGKLKQSREIPEIGLKISYPDSWYEVYLDDLDAMMARAKEQIDIPENLTSSAKEVKKNLVFTILKEQVVNGLRENTNCNVFVFEVDKGEWDETNIEKITFGQMWLIKQELPTAKVTANVLPLRKQPEVGNYVTELTFGTRKLVQYNYVYLYYPFFVQITFTAAEGDEEKDIKKIVKSMEIEVHDP